MQDRPLLIAIDGDCAAGKSTLAEMLQEMFHCTVFHMDDYYLPFELRTDAVKSVPGWNSHRQRIIQEILQPVFQGSREVFWAPFDCSAGQILEKRSQTIADIVVVEGSYACHPEIYAYFDLHIFLEVDPQTQIERLKMRNPAHLNQFKEEWIPMEKAYFSAYKIKSTCELCLKG